MFFAGLLLLNIGFAGWYWFLYEPETPQAPRVHRGVEMLRLATEQQAVEETDTLVATAQQDIEEPAIAVAAPIPATKDSPDSGNAAPPVTEKKEARQQRPPAKASRSSKRQCYQMGLFAQKEKAEYRLSEIQALGYNAKLTTRYQKRAKYLVYLPAYPSYAEASKVTDQLTASGQQDFQILTILGEKNSISLGVYSQPHTAEIRRKEIAALGYEPLVDQVYGGRPLGYNIEFSKKNGSALEDNERDFLLISEEKLSIEPAKCGS
jgi:hypothetical protein